MALTTSLISSQLAINDVIDTAPGSPEDFSSDSSSLRALMVDVVKMPTYQQIGDITDDGYVTGYDESRLYEVYKSAHQPMSFSERGINFSLLRLLVGIAQADPPALGGTLTPDFSVDSAKPGTISFVTYPGVGVYSTVNKTFSAAVTQVTGNYASSSGILEVGATIQPISGGALSAGTLATTPLSDILSVTNALPMTADNGLSISGLPGVAGLDCTLIGFGFEINRPVGVIPCGPNVLADTDAYFRDGKANATITATIEYDYADIAIDNVAKAGIALTLDGTSGAALNFGDGKVSSNGEVSADSNRLVVEYTVRVYGSSGKPLFTVTNFPASGAY